MSVLPLLWRNMKWRYHNAFTIVMTILQPMLWLVLYSAVAGQTMKGAGISNYTAFILPGLVVLVSFRACSSGPDESGGQLLPHPDCASIENIYHHSANFRSRLLYLSRSRYFIWSRAFLFCENCFWFCRHAADCTDCIPDSFFHVRSDLCNQPAPAQRGHLRNCHECSRAASLFSQHRLISSRYLDRPAENNSQFQSPHPRDQHFAHLAVTGRSPLA